MVLFHDDIGHRSQKVRIVIAEKGITCNLEVLSKDDLPKEILEINPDGHLPLLVDRFFRNDKFSVLDAVIIPILLRLDHHQIKIPNNKASKPLFDYIERMQDLPSVKESFTSLEIELL